MKPRNHKHADMIRRWLDDASLCVQSRHPHCAAWQDVDKPEWFEGQEYRFKPRTIRIGDMEVPEPMRVAPAHGEFYWAVDLIATDLCMEMSWSSAITENRWVSNGTCHATKEAAIQHAKALIALTEVKQ